MRVVPAHHLQVLGKLVPLARDLLPRLVRELEAPLGGLEVLGPQAVGDDHERPALFVLILAPQQHAAQFDAGVADGVRLDVAHHVQVDEDRQVAFLRRFVRRDRIVLVAVRPTLRLGLRLFEIAELDVEIHGEEMNCGSDGADVQVQGQWH